MFSFQASSWARCVITGMAASVEGSSPSLEDNGDYDEDGNDLCYASMSLRLFNDQFLENTSFRYLTFDEWQTGKVIQDAYAIVERPPWLQEFYAKCARHGVPPVIQNPPLMYRSPMFICDRRFARRKREKVFVCDNCGFPVPYSSVKRNTGSRALYDFAGSYVDHSWARNIPGECVEEAWERGLIDCTWVCFWVCGAPVTGAGKDRWSRPALHRERSSLHFSGRSL